MPLSCAPRPGLFPSLACTLALPFPQLHYIIEKMWKVKDDYIESVSICDRRSFASSKSAECFTKFSLDVAVVVELSTWSEEPSGGLIWQLVTRSGAEDNITSVVVAIVSITCVCPVCKNIRLCRLTTLLDEELRTETSMLISQNNRKLEYKRIFKHKD